LKENQVIKLKRLTGLVVLGAALAGGATMAFAFKGQEYAKEAIQQKGCPTVCTH